MASRMDLIDIPSNAVLTVSAKIHISAPASHVFDILLHSNTWPEWNPFVPYIKVTHPGPESKPDNQGPEDDDLITLGSQMAFQVRMKPKAPDSLTSVNCLVTKLTSQNSSPDGGPSRYSVSWIDLGYPKFLLRADRTTDCVAASDADPEQGCEFRTWEFMTGPLAYLVKAMYGQLLQDKFEETAQCIKEYAEKTWQSKS